jgi:hypothetical protein
VHEFLKSLNSVVMQQPIQDVALTVDALNISE